MKVVLIEDDEFKASRVKLQLIAVMKEIGGPENITVCQSYNSGLRACDDPELGLLVLDMTLPTFDNAKVDQGGIPRPFGGLEIIEELDRESIQVPVIVVTGFDIIGEGTEKMTLGELEKDLSQRFPSFFYGAIHYSSSGAEWREDLSRLVKAVLNSRKVG